MNTVYYMLRNEFEADDTYTGSDIMKVVLKTIKVRTNLHTSRILNEQFNKLTSVFYASVLLLIINFVITLSK